MGGKYQAYPEYKDSEVEWIGCIPKNWQVTPLFGVASTESIKNESGSESNVLSLSYGNIIKRDVEENFGLLPESFNTYQMVNPGELILRLTDLQNDKRSLRVGYSKEKGIITSAYLKLIAERNKLNDRFLYRLLHSYDTTKVFYGMGGGLRQSMKFDDMRRLPILVPLLDEQLKIANFLDHETAKIDALIEKQQQLIKLLKEKRQAVISHAVTKGLNPNARMRNSGVEWLGEVPEHWDVCKLKHIISALESGVSVNAADVPAYGDELGVLKTSCVYTRSFRVEENKTVLKEEENRVKCPIRKGAIIISRMNTPELVGASALVEIDEANIYLPDRLWQTVFASNVILNPKFISFFMMIKGFRNQISLAAEGASSSMQNIAKDDYLSINIALPDIAEQNGIVSYLEKKLEGFQKLEEYTNKAIELMQERRIALISAAVTGKIDVRDWQAPND